MIGLMCSQFDQWAHRQVWLPHHKQVLSQQPLPLSETQVFDKLTSSGQLPICVKACVESRGWCSSELQIEELVSQIARHSGESSLYLTASADAMLRSIAQLWNEMLLITKVSKA
jgi:hypothetical protein